MRAVSTIAAVLLSVAIWALGIDSAFADKRVALVLGNTNYLKTTKLANPENDANDVAETLRGLGFEVIVKTNTDKLGLDSALEEFERKSRGSDTALFYFAGHGLQYRGRNYLLPVDADLEDEVSLRYNAMSIEKVREALDAAGGVKILVLDACRNNPLSEKLVTRTAGLTRSTELTRGLARLDRTEGMVVAYATQADQVAQDGTGRNSPFSSALIRRLKEPNLEIATLFRRVAQDVYETTSGKQRPELSISLLQDFYLNLRDDDSRVWRRIEPDASETDLRDFIGKFPNSPYVRDAQNRLAVLERVRKERDEMSRRLKELEAERQEWQRREIARHEAEKAEREKREKERLEQDRVAIEKRDREQQERDRRLADQMAREKAAAQQAAEQADKERKEAERLAALAAEKQRLADAQKAEQERRRVEAERLAFEKKEKERLEVERLAAEKLDRERKEAERLAAAAAEKQRLAEEAKLDKERRQQAKLEADKAAAEQRAQQERLAAAEKAERDRKEAERVAALAAEKQRAEAERLAKAETEKQEKQAKAEAEKQEKERIRVAKLEDEARAKAELAATRQKQAEACARESAEVARLSGEKQKAGLESLKPQISCPGLVASIDKAIGELVKAQERACVAEQTALRRIDDKNLQALRVFVSGAGCADVKTAANTKIVALEAAAAKTAEVCKADGERFAGLKDKSTDQGLLLKELRTFQGAIACDSLKPTVAEAIKLLSPPTDTPEQIKTAQTELKRIGCYAGEATGSMSGPTKDALRRYFEARKVQMTGEGVGDPLVIELKNQPESVCKAPANIAAKPKATQTASRPAVDDDDEDDAPVRPRKQRVAPKPEAPVRVQRVEAPRPARVAPRPVASAPPPGPTAAAPRRSHAIGVGF